MDLVSMVRAFQLKFGQNYDGPPRNLNPLERQFRIDCMDEEINEYVLSKRQETDLDAMVDLVYFAIGTALRQGFDFNEAFTRVHYANMLKIASPSKRDKGRGSRFDIVKPHGWTPPDLSDLVKDSNDDPDT
jgi:predicted HAD superfamily Cof-like phosphohydrolase